MSIQTAPETSSPQTEDGISELQAFHEFLVTKLQHGKPFPTLEEAVEEWRLLYSGDVDDDYEAIKEAVDAMDAGDTGRPFEEFMAELRQRHDIPARP